MVDDKLSRKKRIDKPRITAHSLDRFAHGGQINHGGHAGEILQQNARRHERNFFLFGSGRPVREKLNVLRMNEAPVLAAQKIFKKDTKRKWQFRQIAGDFLFKKFEAVNIEQLRANI